METTRTTTSISFTDASKKDWFLSTKPASPKQTISVTFENGKSYKYLGTSKVKPGDPVIIDWGGATSYHMGNVDSIEEGVTIKRSHALKPLFVFSTSPESAEIKRNSLGMCLLEDEKDIESYFNLGEPHSENRFRIIDFLVSGVLNAITVVAFPAMSKPETVKKAKEYLKAEKTIPSLMFTKAFTDHFYGEFWDGITYAEQAEVALTGFYPGWNEQIQNCEFVNSDAFKSLDIDLCFENNVYYMYFSKGSAKRAKFFAENDEFKHLSNELVMRSALSILIRGGFVNLLKAALSTQMPIKGFYQKLIAFADEIGSAECSALLKSEDYENKVFESAEEKKVTKGSSKTSVTGGKKLPQAVKISADKSFKIKDAVLIQYKGKDEIVSIPDGITTIGDLAFYENKTIKKVIIPDSVTQIKKAAFQWCRQLQEVVLGKNVSTLGISCFLGCTLLSSIDFSNTKVKILPKEAFDDCDSLRILDLSKSNITKIKESAFRGSGLERIILPQKLESIGDSAFTHTKISELVIPATVKEIAYEAFLGVFGGHSALKRIVFEGTDSIQFWVNSVEDDCVIVCKKGSALMEMLEKQNADNEAKQKSRSYFTQNPRKLEGV